MEIKFELITQSYMKAHLKLNNLEIEIAHSALVKDGFQELLTNLFYIKTAINENNLFFFPYQTKITWEDDFIVYSWSISIESPKSAIHFEIIKTSLGNPDYKINLWDNSISINNLFECVFISLDKLYSEFGLIGYKSVWGIGNFPISEYLILKAEKRDYKMSCAFLGEDDEWKCKISKEDEILLLGLS